MHVLICHLGVMTVMVVIMTMEMAAVTLQCVLWPGPVLSPFKWDVGTVMSCIPQMGKLSCEVTVQPACHQAGPAPRPTQCLCPQPPIGATSCR